jgi:hypothetical protein
MNELFKKAISLINLTDSSRPLKKLTERELINLESAIGAKLFGPIPDGHRREFFCLDEKTWIWYEEWIDEKRLRQQITTRYEIQDQGILKVQSGPRYEYIKGQELENLTLAVKMYYEQVARGVYKVDPKINAKK